MDKDLEVLDHLTLSEPVTVSNEISRPKILYIVPFRGKNNYRKKNIKIVLQWLNNVKESLMENYNVTFDICVIEQDREPYDQLVKENIDYKFVSNPGLFSKGWAFNVVVKQHPEYQYYCFADADIIVPDIDFFTLQIIEHCIVNPKSAFRPFTDRLDIEMTHCQTITDYDALERAYPTIKSELTRHDGLSFATNMIFMSKETYDLIGGWDEMFRGWGRYDDFISHKLMMIAQCTGCYSPTEAVHLWHPVTLDFSLNQDNVRLYDKYIKYDKPDLLSLIDNNRKIMGNPDLYVVVST